MSQEDLSARLQLAGFDIGRSTIGHWEQSRYSPPFDNPQFTKILAEILDLPVPVMLQMAGFELNITHSDAGERVAHMVDEMPPEVQDLVVRIVEQFKR